MKVDVKKVLKDKNPTAAKWIPWFVINYLKKIVHEDEVNFYLENFSHLPTIEFIRATLEGMGISYTAVGLDKLDPEGRYIFASNHPFGGLDGLMLADKISGYFGDVRVVVNDLLMNLEPLKPIFIPVNKHGKQNQEYARLYREAFESNIPIITFPAGLCSRKTEGVVQDIQWRPNFVKQAVNTKRDIVPVYFDGCLSNFFYRLSNLRKKVGIKANIEMLYLSDEMFRQHGKHFDMIIGEPVPWATLEDKPYMETAREIRTIAYNLKKQTE